MVIKKKNILRITKYFFSSVTSFILDLILFSFFYNFLKNTFNLEAILVSTIIARIFSSLYNYWLNSKFVFKKNSKYNILKYYLLVLIQMIVSALTVYIINKKFYYIYPSIIKIIIECLLFIINYLIQKKFIFSDNKNK